MCTKPRVARLGPWHCPRCLKAAKRAGRRDVTLDSTLMDYLGGGPAPEDPDTFARCARAARFMWIDDDDGSLWVRGRYYPRV